MDISPTGMPYTTTDAQGYRAMLSLLSRTLPVSAEQLTSLWSMSNDFATDPMAFQSWLVNFCAGYQLTLQGNALDGWFCQGSLLRRRLCTTDCLTFLHRYCSDENLKQFSSSVQQRLSENQLYRASYDNINLTALLDYCDRVLERPSNPINQAILIDLIRLSLCDSAEDTLIFSLTQLAWIRTKAEYRLLVKILGYWQRRNGLKLRQYACEFWALMLYLSYPPEEHDFTTPCQRDLLANSREFLRRFANKTDLPLNKVKQAVIPLYNYVHHLISRQILALTQTVSHKHATPSRLLKETINQIFKSTKLSSMSLLCNKEIDALAETLVNMVSPLIDYQQPTITILTNGNCRIEQQLSREISDCHFFPVHFNYQSLDTFQRVGAPRNSSFVLSLYPCRLPLNCPPLLQVQLPFNCHQKQYVHQLLNLASTGQSAISAFSV